MRPSMPSMAALDLKPSSMKLLLTNHELDEAKGGTQAFLMDLARELKAHGHEVAVYSPRLGPLAEELRSSGVPVTAKVREAPFVPEVIHGQHHLPTIAALCAFPEAPALYYCHGYRPWEEQPPVHPRIRRHVGMAKALAPWMAGVTGRKPEDIAVVPNSIRLERFQQVRKLGLHPRRALVFGNTVVSGENLSKLRQACEQSGMTLDLVGAAFGEATTTPEDLLPQYDVVFAVGRCALEALASGCVVIPFSSVGAMPIVLPDTLLRHMEANFSVPETVRPLTVEYLVENLQQFDSGRAAEVTRAVRAELSFERICRQFEELYVRVKTDWNTAARPAEDEEHAAVVTYLEALSGRVGSTDLRYEELLQIKDRTRVRLGKQKNKLDALEQKHAELRGKYEALDKKWKWVERRLPGFLRNWLLRGLK